MPGARAPDWWIEAWQEAYCTPESLRPMVAGIPLYSTDSPASLESQTNLQSAYIDVDDPAITPAALAAQLFADPRTAMVSLNYLSEHSTALALLRRVEGFALLQRRHARRALTDTRRSYDDWMASRTPRNRKRLRRIESGLPAHIADSFQVHEQADDSLLNAVFALEADGWKGREGSAVCQNEDDLAFYRNLARRAAAAGTLRLATIHDGPKMVAFELNMVRNGRLLSTKVGYDETYVQHEPGNWLALRVIRYACAEPDIVLIDMLGNSQHIVPGKARFADLQEELWQVRLFRRTLHGRMLHAAYAAHQFLRTLKGKMGRSR